jgi:hypothetical protein
MEGLEAEAGQQYVHAETADEWASALKSVLCQADLRRSLATNARQLVERSYDWATLRPRLRAAYDCLAQ